MEETDRIATKAAIVDGRIIVLLCVALLCVIILTLPYALKVTVMNLL